jgi:thiamine-phosphate pyrophosphorylase
MIHAIVDRARPVRADIVHVRNKQLESRSLLELTQWLVGAGHRVVVNTRCDVALAARAAGVHLPGNWIDLLRYRAIVPPGFLIGASCHSREELLRAQGEGADYAYLSPVFAPLSKQDERPPLGLDGFSRMVAGLTIPVLALGGVTAERIPECLAAGAAGVAGISLAGELSQLTS